MSVKFIEKHDLYTAEQQHAAEESLATIAAHGIEVVRSSGPTSTDCCAARR